MNAAADAAPEAGTGPRSRTRLDRVLAAIPLAGLCLLVVSFYVFEAWTRKTPWLFSDELEWSQLSRSIASTGHAARRGEPIFFKSIYACLIAPIWWIHSTQTAYNGIKYLNAVMMSLAGDADVLPRADARHASERRSRRRCSRSRSPACRTSTSIIPEPLAYTWFALCCWLIVRALATRRLRDVALALVVCVAAVVRES